MRTKQSEALWKVLRKMTVPVLDARSSYQQVHLKFAFVVVRDALMEFGVNFQKAEKLAAENHGCVRIRYKKCLHQLDMQ